MEVVADLQSALPCTATSVLCNGDASSAASVHPVVHVEVCLKATSCVKPDVVKQHVKQTLSQHRACVGDFTLTSFDDPCLSEHVESVAVCDTDALNKENECLSLQGPHVMIHVFHLHEEGAGQEELDGEEEIAAANHWLLPSRDFHGLWDSLVFDASIKSELLQYAATTLLFSDRQVDHNIISWNRVVLLHGPPGTGKTSLCKALAQKLCIQLSDRYSYGQLIEINSHSLFSKWFSESGKLVMKMFQKIQELLDDQDALVCVLIDEVESLTAARKAAMSGTEPSDAIRVVNALLTQLDQIKKNPNVLILTTSNVTGAIDLAFVDRADIKQYIGLPGPSAIYKIYHSCITELTRAGIIYPSEQILDLRTLRLMVQSKASQISNRLHNIAVRSEGLSGRTLRKIPFIAHAVFIQSPRASLDKFLDALEKAVDKQFQDRHDLSKS